MCIRDRAKKAAKAGKPRRGRPPKAEKGAPEQGKPPKAGKTQAAPEEKAAPPAPEVPPTPRDATRAEKEEIVYLCLLYTSSASPSPVIRFWNEDFSITIEPEIVAYASFAVVPVLSISF